MTDIELQRWLAEQLPEEICIMCYEQGVPRFFWVDSAPVTPREWLHVVSLVEAKLTDEQHRKVRTELFIHAYTVKKSTSDEAERIKVSASWQLRAQALIEVLK